MALSPGVQLPSFFRSAIVCRLALGFAEGGQDFDPIGDRLGLVLRADAASWPIFQATAFPPTALADQGHELHQPVVWPSLCA